MLPHVSIADPAPGAGILTGILTGIIAVGGIGEFSSEDFRHAQLSG